MVPARVAAAAARDACASGWTRSPELAVYRFAIEEVFRLQEHVLNEQGERLLSLSERLGSVPKDAYAALSTADARFPTITLSTGESTQVSYGQYRKLLATCRSQADRRAAYEALYDTYTASLNTYAAIYNGVMQRRLVRGARARLQDHARCGAVRQRHPDQRRREPDSRDQGRRRAVPPLSPAAQARARRWPTTTCSTRSCRWSTTTSSIAYDEVLDWIVEAVAPLGADYQARVRAAFAGALDRRLREPGQAQRRVFGAGVRRQSVHADELQRHARRGVHAGARARPLDAHACCRTRRSRSSMRATRSSSPRCRRR